MRLLLVEDDAQLARRLGDRLREAAFAVDHAGDIAQGEAWPDLDKIGAVILDLSLPDGTGLTDRFSDYVGRVTLKYGSWIELTERFRLDKDHLAVRRNEFDATIGSKKTYLLVGYLLLNRNIDTSIEDLRDRQEIRLGARVQIARYWSIYGSTVIDLTTTAQDPTSLSNGFQPVRNRVGVTYEDECLSIGVSWRQDFNPVGDARRGSTFALRLALKNIGR